ncbi:TRAP transporter small permease [Alteromonas sp. 1_MG-2023]|uniref:TRAP transporter small permease n=1 Tax=Alteromonas sp. 1_MG-2023 TaxID=3062669 RepID=UPI0026E3CD35|nr:TRAP transporter small permease [Alteromonas sp. 1_MG-2023]MDO6566661.1 TRAP transporter small permease [Alteromonas sp. 1_MG-2023]
MSAKRLNVILNNIENYLCQFLLCVFVILLFAQVVLRVVFNHGYPWIEELSRFAFVWFVYLGAAYGAQKMAHNRVTIQLSKLPEKVRICLDILSDFIWITFNTLLTYKSIEIIILMFEFTYHTPALDWSMAYLYMIFPLSLTLMTIRILQNNYLRFFTDKNIDVVEETM